MIVDEKFLKKQKWKKFDDDVWTKKGLKYNLKTQFMVDNLDWSIKIIGGKQDEFISCENRYRNWPNV